MLLSLLGVDVLLVALSWGALFAALSCITVITWEPMLVMCASVWSYVLSFRVVNAFAADGCDTTRAYYRDNQWLLLFLWLGVVLCTLWLLFFCVGRCYIKYLTLPLFFLFLANVPFLRKWAYYNQLLLSISFVFICSIPAHYYSFVSSPFHILVDAHLWCIICLFWVFNVLRVHLKKVNPMEYRNAAALMILIWVLLPCAKMWIAAEVSDYDFRFSSIICFAAIALATLICMLRKFAVLSRCFETWLVMSVPALIGLLLYAPKSWFI